MSRVSLVLARADNGVIGANNAIPWRIADDMKRFKAITMGKPIVMGRKTWDSFPKKPLPGRSNIVITRDTKWRADGAVTVHTFQEALARARSEQPDEIAVIGGAEIYRLALPHADTVHLTQVLGNFKGDVTMAPFGPEWRETAREDHTTPGGLRYSYVTLRRG